MENNALDMLEFMQAGPVGSFVKEVFKHAEKHAEKGDQDTAKEILDVCEDTLLAYKRAVMMTELMEERQSLVSQAERMVSDNQLKVPTRKPNDDMNSAKAKKARKLIEGILKNDKKSS